MKQMMALGAMTLLAASAATAQTTPSVELYGIVDAGLVRVSGLKGGTGNFLASGIMEGTRWGLRGNEDLGGGYRTLFTLESRVELDTGSTSNRPLSGTQLPDRASVATLMGLPASMQPFVSAVGASLANSEAGVNLPGRLFDRQAYVGLVTPVGAVLAGRMYTPAYELNANFDIMKTESSLAAGQVAAFPASKEIRISNALAYRLQLNGITGAFMYGLGEVSGDSSKSRFLGVLAMYKGPGYAVGIAHNTRKNELGQSSLTNTSLGASMDVGPGTISAMAIDVKDNNPAGLSAIAASLPASVGGLVQDAFIRAFKQDARWYHIGYRYITGPSTISVAYTTFNDKRPNNADVKSYGVAYTYALSKRTDLNAILTRFNNSGLGQAAPGQAGFFGGVTENAGKDSTSMAFGIRHRF